MKLVFNLLKNDLIRGLLVLSLFLWGMAGTLYSVFAYNSNNEKYILIPGCIDPSIQGRFEVKEELSEDCLTRLQEAFIYKFLLACENYTYKNYVAKYTEDCQFMLSNRFQKQNLKAIADMELSIKRNKVMRSSGPIVIKRVQNSKDEWIVKIDVDEIKRVEGDRSSRGLVTKEKSGLETYRYKLKEVKKTRNNAFGVEIDEIYRTNS